MIFEPACMAPDELALWLDANRKLVQPASSPCMDCSPSWCAAMRAVGKCNGEPETPVQGSGLTRNRPAEKRRESNRLAQQRWRQRNPGRRR